MYDNGRVYADLDATGTVTVRYVRSESGELNAVIAGLHSAWLVTDRLGSVRAVVATAGTGVLDRIAYDGFGTVVSESDPAQRGSFGFTGLALDPVTGLTHAHWRELDTALGQWTQEDPMGFAAGDANVRRYVGNDPVNRVDPSGLDELILGGPNGGDASGVYFKLTRSVISPRYLWSGDPVYRLGDYVRKDGEEYVFRNNNYVPLREVQNNTASTFGNMTPSSWDGWFAAHAVTFTAQPNEMRWRDAGPLKLREVFLKQYGVRGKELLAKMDKAGIGILHGEFGLGGYGAYRFKNSNDIVIDTDYNVFPARGDRSVSDAAKELLNALTDPDIVQEIDRRIANQSATILTPVSQDIYNPGVTTLTENRRWLNEVSHEGPKLVLVTVVTVGAMFLPIPGMNAAFDLILMRFGALVRNGKWVRLIAGGTEREMTQAEALALAREAEKAGIFKGASAVFVRGLKALEPTAERALLKSEAEQLAMYIAKGQSKAERGAVLTMIRDRVTGEVFHAQNLSVIPDKLHPLLQTRLKTYLQAKGGNLNPVWAAPGTHSEISALNQALLRRDAIGLPVKSLDEFGMYNVSLWSNRVGTVVPRCGNCKFLTDGVRILSGD